MLEETPEPTTPVSIPRSLSAEVSGKDTGPLFTVKRYLHSTSRQSIVAARSHENLSLSDNKIVAATEIGVNRNQTVTIREETSSLAIEYPVILKGKTPKVTKVPTVLANSLVVQTKGPVSAQTSFSFDVGTDTPAVSYVTSSKCENEVWIWTNEDRSTGLQFLFLGGSWLVPNIYVDGKRVGTSSPAGNGAFTSFAAGEQLDLVTDAKHNLMVYRGGELVHTYSGGEFKAIISEEINAGRFVHVLRNGFAGAEQNPQVTVSGGNTSPLTLKSSSIDADGRAFWNIDYIGAPKYGYVYSVEDLSGKVIQPWTNATIVKNVASGKATLTASTIAPEANVPYIYKFVEASAKNKPNADAMMLTMKRTRPGTPSIGSNVAGMYTPYRKTRVYTNMFSQCYVQNTSDWSFLDFIANPDKIDFLGNPLVSNLIYQLSGPEKEGSYTLEVTASEGILLASNISFMGTGGAIDCTRIQQNGPNSILIGVVVKRDALLVGNTPMFGLVFRNVEATLPKGLFCCETTDDKTKRFYGPFVDRLSKINGPMRHMDNNWANEAARYLGSDSWEKHRSRRDRVGAQKHGIALEDLVELSVLTNRPIWFNINHGLLYSEAGLDYLTRSLDLVFNGVGGDLGYGVSRLLRHKVEGGNENWNFGLGNWHFLAQQAKACGRGTWTGDGEKHGVAQRERLYNWVKAIDILMKVVPNYGDFIDRVFGAQSGRSDISFISGEKLWPDVLARTDRLSIAAYLPGDPNAGYGEGQQPASHSPEDVVTWLRTSLPKLISDLSDEVQYYRNTYNLPTDFYEWNIAFPAIGNRTAAEERLIKSSDVFYRFMKDEYIAGVVPIGGDSCIYSDDGIPSSQQSWYFYESSYTGAGNMSWQALLDYANEKGYVPVKPIVMVR